VPEAPQRDRLRNEQREAVLEQIARYNPSAVVCIGVPFGHTRPQWIIPHGGSIRLDGADRVISADYS
jgi:muramoyltetrapeptide carboxypeptidase LdcA involved in peptidoglycan recycling